MARAGQEPPLDAHHPWMPGNPLTRGIPQSRNSSGQGPPRSRASLAEPTGMVNLSSGIPQEFIG